MFVYNIPYSHHNMLCRILDAGDQLWRNLAGEIGKDALEVSELEREYFRINGSPTGKLLSQWGHLNATVDMLAGKLIAIRALRAFDVIKCHVSKHVLESFSEQLAPFEAPLNQCSFRRSSDVNPSDEDLPVPCSSSRSTNILDMPNKKSGFEERLVEPGDDYCCSTEAKDNFSKGISGYEYATIASATDVFDQRNLLGGGRFSATYRGLILQSVVAVKVKDKGNRDTLPQTFYNDVHLLMKNPHRNIMSLLGISTDGPSFCFVYDFMENGSLRDRLECKDGTPPLTWAHRHTILRDASQGLLFLHNSCTKPVLHKNIKSSNILLDVNFVGKLGDFGFLHKSEGTGQTTTNMTRVTTKDELKLVDEYQPYMPVDFFSAGNRHTLSTDVHAFGVVILETCTGKDAVEWLGTHRQSLAEFIHDQFSSCENDAKRLISSVKDSKAPCWDDKLWMTLMLLGKLCTSRRVDARPQTQNVNLAIENSYLEVIDKLSQMSKGSSINSDGGRDNCPSNGTKLDKKDMQNITEVINKVQTTYIRNELKNVTDIYSSPLQQQDSLSSKNSPKEEQNEINLSNYVSIDDDINKVRAKMPFPEFCLDFGYVADENDKSSSENYHLKSVERSYSSDKKSGSNCARSDGDNKLDVSFSSKDSRDTEISSSAQLASSSGSTELESLIKQLLRQDQERFAKLEKLKQEFPEEFSSSS